MCNILSRHKGALVTKVNAAIYFYITACNSWLDRRKVSKPSWPNMIVSCEKHCTKHRAIFKVWKKKKSFIHHLKQTSWSSRSYIQINIVNDVKLWPVQVTSTTGRRRDSLPEDVCMPTIVGTRHKTQSPWTTKRSRSCFRRYRHQNNASTSDRPLRFLRWLPYYVILQSTGSEFGQNTVVM